MCKLIDTINLLSRYLDIPTTNSIFPMHLTTYGLLHVRSYLSLQSDLSDYKKLTSSLHSVGNAWAFGKGKAPYNSADCLEFNLL